MKLPDGIICQYIPELASITIESTELIKCKHCKHCEYDVIDDKFIPGVPVIVAHNMCHFWGNGCATDPDGWCYKGEKEGK